MFFLYQNEFLLCLLFVIGNPHSFIPVSPDNIRGVRHSVGTLADVGGGEESL